MDISQVATLDYLKNQGFDLSGKVVSARVDLNVLTKEGELKVPDPPRIKSLTGLLNFCLETRCKLVLFSHAEVDKKYPSLLNAAMAIPRVTGVNIPVRFIEATAGGNVFHAAQDLVWGMVLILENTRQDERETRGDVSLAEEVFNALGRPSVHVLNNMDVAHRPKHSLVGPYAGLVKENGGYYLPSEHLLSQVQEIDDVVWGKEIVFVLAGAKDKDTVAAQLVKSGRLVKMVIPGGGFLVSLLAAKGIAVNPKNKGAEEKQIQNAKKFIDYGGIVFHVPVDVRVASELTPQAEQRIVDLEAVTEEMLIGDIGPATEMMYHDVLLSLAKERFPIVASCAMGKEDFSLSGTWALIKALREASEYTKVLIIGDDSNKLVDKAINAGVIPDRGTMRKSTAGGAAAEYIALNCDLPTLKFTKKAEVKI